MVISFIFSDIKMISSKERDILDTMSPCSKDSLMMWEYIREETDKDEVIIFFKPRVLYLFTERLSFATNDIKRFKEADYLLLINIRPPEYAINGYQVPWNIDMEEELGNKIILVKENNSFRMYKILK